MRTYTFTFDLILALSPHKQEEPGFYIQPYVGSRADAVHTRCVVLMSKLLLLSIPPGYYMGMCVAAPEKNLGYIHQVSVRLDNHWCLGCTFTWKGTASLLLMYTSLHQNKSLMHSASTNMSGTK